MSLKDLLVLSPVPGLDAAVTILTATWNNVQNVKVYKQQCHDLSTRCTMLILALNEGMQNQHQSNDWATELENVVRAINAKVQEWARLNRLKSFLQQSEIQEALHRFHRRLDGAMDRYHIAATLEFRRGLYESRAILERDKAEMRTVLQQIARDNSDLRSLLSETSGKPLEEIMEHFQTELMDPEIPKPQKDDFRFGLWWLHSRSSKLPPLPDLTGQVTKESEHVAFFGTFNDIYKGRWLNEKMVALRLPRSLPNTPRLQRRFEEEVKIWRKLNHPNVLTLYGITKIGQYVYLVSPWMDNGTAINYIQKNPNVDRLGLLEQITSGLEYLHSQNIVHGDIRGANILISENGVALLADFGLSKFLGDIGTVAQAMTVTVASNPRWSAPEILRNAGSKSTVSPYSKKSDIWSIGMTFLELLTGECPYAYESIDVAVLRLIDNNETPKRPREGKYHHNITDHLWKLMTRCWKMKPDSRPDIAYVRGKLIRIREEAYSPDAAQQSTQAASLFSPSFISTRVGTSRHQRVATVDNYSVVSSNSGNDRNRPQDLPTLDVPQNGNLSHRPPSLRPSTSGSSNSGNSSNSGGPSKHRPNAPRFSPIDEDTALSPTSYSSSPPSISPLSAFSAQALTGRSPAKRQGTGFSGFSGTNANKHPAPPSPSASISSSIDGNYRREFSSAPRLPPVSPPSSAGLLSELGWSKSSSSNSASSSRTVTQGTAYTRMDLRQSNGTRSNGNSGQNILYENNEETTPHRATPSSSPPNANHPCTAPLPMKGKARSIDTVGVKSIFSTNSSVQPSDELQTAISSPEPIVYTNADRVTAGTLQGLVERLINNFNLQKDMEFRDVMLTACIDFITPEDMFNILIRRFEDAEQGSDMRPELRLGIQYTIFKVLMYWLLGRHLPVNTALLWRMEEFCQSAIKLKTSQPMIMKGNELLQLIEERIAEQRLEESRSSPFDLSPDRRVLSSSQITPRDLAIALTLLEGDKFRKIQPCDYLAHQRRQPISGYLNHVKAAAIVNTRIVQWVKQSILHFDEVRHRADVIKFYINTARNLLSEKFKKWLNEIVSILYPMDDYAAYRSALREIHDPQYADYCIPWLELHLDQLALLLRENSRVVEIDHHPLINFKRYLEYVKQFKSVLGFTPADLEEYRDQGQLAYLEHQLAGIEVTDSADDEMMKRSLELEQGETKLYEHRVLERQSLGFATPRKYRTSGK
ncbi:TKL/TKL-ccin protein kinase [Coprinopsis cinerea okayama7|uniref:TKL/TKL-ccin protein kinase n=1 Tax=Coprinopsis cinerea (strain Okayama-7 / 130 / ATCC MYA-4618 / FGSC 9003) TaxID=240176 RepID=D6RKH6_COPC7|nr:TKL/TKL-ccin protein kinase [Coprinopsis cinerea okayama7\|eukprot:XP_002911921.1 TKL/TKL-ccin protein kinase [Coprinopsis cinerea okayama7\